MEMIAFHGENFPTAFQQVVNTILSGISDMAGCILR